jgi:CRISPR/Cas system-associated exonuclease Cas4 (RecB family)
MVALLLLGSGAFAQPRVGVMTLRVSQPGAVTPGTVQAASALLWQGAASGAVIPVAESTVAVSVGVGGALASCARDDCMAQIGSVAGLDRVVYAVAVPANGGYTLYVRTIAVNPFAVVSERAPSCAPCGEAEILSMLASTDIGAMASAGAALGAPVGAGLGGGGGKPAKAAKPARVTIKSKPSGAQVILGTRILGTTPLSRFELPAGEHVLKLALAGFAGGEVKVKAKPGRTAKATVKLKRIPETTGYLTMTSTPPGATVSLAGRPIGTTPFKGLEIYHGEHILQLHLPGHLPAEVKIKVAGGGKARKSVKLKRIPPTTGVLHVTTKPPGATVVSGGRNWGVTPLSMPRMPPGEYRLEVSLANHATAEAVAKVAAGKERKVTVTLKALGALAITVLSGGQPVPAELTVDGSPAGRAPTRVPGLMPGTHTVEAVAPGLKPVVRKVKVRGGGVTEVQIELKRPMGMLTVSSTPKGAEVHSGAQLLGKTPLRRKAVPAGAHSLTVRLEGYAEQTARTEVGDGKEAKVDVTLPPLPGTLVVKTTAGGQELPGTPVKVDGRFAGNTPLTLTGIPAGKHTVEIERRGMVPVKREVVVKPGGKAELALALRIPKGTLNIETRPNGAEVRMGETVLGKTPLRRFTLAAGQHRLNLRLDGYIDAVVELSLKDGKVVSKKVTLDPTPPVLVVETAPAGAEVKIDGHPAGKTPLRRDDLPIGSHEIEISLKGHHVVTRSVKLQKQKVTKLEERLLARTGSLTVATTPAGAEVIVDGKVLGKTPLAPTAVLEGEHVVTLQLERYGSATRRVMINEGGSASISVTLSASPGVLSVSTTPAGAAVTLDGKVVGVTPYRLESVPVGAHTVRVQLADHKVVEQRAPIGPAQVLDLAIPLELTDAARAAINLESARAANQIWMISAWATGAIGVGVGAFFLNRDHQEQLAVDEAIFGYNSYGLGDHLLDENELAARAVVVSDAQYDLDNGKSRAFGITGVAVGAALLCVGSYLYLFPPGGGDASEASASPGLLPLPGGGFAVGLGGSLR